MRGLTPPICCFIYISWTEGIPCYTSDFIVGDDFIEKLYWSNWCQDPDFTDRVDGNKMEQDIKITTIYKKETKKIYLKNTHIVSLKLPCPVLFLQIISPDNSIQDPQPFSKLQSIPVLLFSLYYQNKLPVQVLPPTHFIDGCSVQLEISNGLPFSFFCHIQRPAVLCSLSLSLQEIHSPRTLFDGKDAQPLFELQCLSLQSSTPSGPMQFLWFCITRLSCLLRIFQAADSTPPNIWGI